MLSSVHTLLDWLTSEKSEKLYFHHLPTCSKRKGGVCLLFVAVQFFGVDCVYYTFALVGWLVVVVVVVCYFTAYTRVACVLLYYVVLVAYYLLSACLLWRDRLRYYISIDSLIHSFIYLLIVAPFVCVCVFCVVVWWTVLFRYCVCVCVRQC